MPMDTFALAAGTVRGYEHSRVGRNNQDACAFAADDERILALVCDGCGSGRYSEVGAQLGARLLLAALRRRAAERPPEGGPAQPIEKVLERARRDVVRSLADLARQMGEPRVATVRDYLLFTVVGVAVEARETVVFALGDGVAALNGELVQLRFTGNKPPYLGYGLIPRALSEPDLGRRGFSLLARCATEDLDSLLIATDGLVDLPGEELEAFWSDGLMFKNPHAIQRRLARLNLSSSRHKRAPRLADDTTAIVIRRRPEGR